MRWYYANNNQRQGPVGELEFARLARDGVIKGDTLVWRHGMADWKPYSEVVETLPPPEIRPAESVEGSQEQPGSVPQAMREDRESAEEAAPQLDYAGFWIRAAAKMVDMFIIIFFVAITAGLLGIGQSANMPETFPELVEVLQDRQRLASLMEEMAALTRYEFVVSLVYFWLFIAFKEATPGKMVFGLKVVRSNGSKLGYLRSLARFFGEVLNQTLFGIGYLTATFDEQKRTMHDFICDSRVIRKRK